MPNLDWPVIRAAATAGLIIIIPAAVLSEVLVGDGGAANWAFLFWFVILIGFVIAGFGAGARRSDTPLMHGATAALVAYVVVQLFGFIKRLIAGETINVFTYPLMALLSATCGVAGAVFADWNRRRNIRT